jgi:hypothetical protein
MKSGSTLMCFHLEKHIFTLDPIVYLIILLKCNLRKEWCKICKRIYQNGTYTHQKHHNLKSNMI